MLIVTDGAVDLDPGLEAAGRVRTVAGPVWIDATPFRSTREEFWRRVRKGAVFATAPPTVNALVEAYRHEGLVIGLHVSAELSATVSRAREASERAGPGVVVVDSRSFSAGAGLVAAALDDATRDPGAGDSAAALAARLPEKLHTFALVQDPELLRRSGRAGLLPGEQLSRHRPLVLAVRGRAVLLEQPKDRARALCALASHARESADLAVGSWAIAHGDAADSGQIVEQLSSAFGGPPRFAVPIGPIVGAHLGADAVVVGVLAG